MNKSLLFTAVAVLFFANFNFGQVPPNDNPANAQMLGINVVQPLIFTGSTNLSATNTHNYNATYGYTQAPSCVPTATQQKDVWFKFNSGNHNTLTFTVNETGGSPIYGRANLFRLFSTNNCNGVVGGGTFTEAACVSAPSPDQSLPSFTINGIIPNTCYFLQMSNYLSTGSVWSAFEIAISAPGAPLPLPVLLDFGATRAPDRNENYLYWNTQDESEMNMYIVERKLSGSQNFETIGHIAAKNQLINKYTYWDVCNTNCQYRIKAIDMDNNFCYSNILEISTIKNKNIVISPNPVKDLVKLSLIEDGTVELYSATGKLLYIKTCTKDQEILIDMKENISGMYLLRYITETDINTYKIIKQ